MMPNLDDNDEEPTEYADRFGGLSVGRQEVTGTIEYDVDLTQEQLEDIPESLSAQRVAKSAAASRAENELDLTFSLDAGYCIAETRNESDWSPGKEFTVLVRLEGHN